MHELALMESLVEQVSAQAGGVRVTRIRLDVGRLSCAHPDALRFCFDVCTRGTALQGATLDVVELPGRARCRACDEQLTLDHLLTPCACGSLDLDVQGGEELRIREVEVI